MINYYWNIFNLKSYPEYMGNKNVVFSIIAEYIGWKSKDDTERAHPAMYSYVSSIHVTQDLIINNNTTFTPYEDLTEEQVLGWLLDSLTSQQINEMQEKITTDINAQIEAQIAIDNQLLYMQLPLPWSN